MFNMQWDGKFGPAFIATIIVGVIGMLVQGGVVVWSISSFKTSVEYQFAAQGTKIDQVANGSDKRFETVHTALANAVTTQAATNERVKSVETAIVYISGQIHDVVTRMDGDRAAAPALPPPKP